MPALRTVVSVESDCSLTLDDGTRVRFRALRIRDPEEALSYLRRRVLKKKIFLVDADREDGPIVAARVVLKNRISINAHLVKSGMAVDTPESRS